MDWCCEPTVLKSTGLNVLQHIGNTVENGRQLIDYDKESFVMVLQGWETRDYLTCLDYCKDYGLLTKMIGVGTICGRTDAKQVYDILRALRYELPDQTEIHCFGLSLNLLKYKEIFDKIDSMDTHAWSRSLGLNVRQNAVVSVRKEMLLNYSVKLNDMINKNNRQSVLAI